MIDAKLLSDSAAVSAVTAPTTVRSQPRVLIFIVAYNAKTTLAWVLDRIPAALRHAGTEVLVIDDSSPDDTFAQGVRYVASHQDRGLKITVLRNPVNQGYGGNQKLGYRYAIDHGFDHVALVHGDGQYAPEKLPDLLAPLLSGEADAVFGSRMLQKRDALRGGMPLYKWLGNQTLTRFQNALLGSNLSEFHSGYRLYSTRALRQIPFERNTNDFHFDTEIIVQLHLAGLRIRELPIPTYYGDEICRVNGMKYAWDVCKTMLRVRCHQLDFFYDRKFDVAPEEASYDLKLGYVSSHTLAIESAQPGGAVLDVGCGQGQVARELAQQRGCRVTGIDRLAPKPAAAEEENADVNFIRWNLDAAEFPVDVSQFDQIFMLDIIEHLRDPEQFMEELRAAARGRRPEIVLTTANIGFFIPRLMLLLGQFNYGKIGILDRTHTRLFTFRSLRALLAQSGYEVLETRGVPAPFPKALGDNFLSRLLVKLNRGLIRLCRGLFSYQIFVRVRALPTVNHLLAETISSSTLLRASLDECPLELTTTER
ncbi:MAG: glycosyltransferase [Verrucomicrobia bacterium]|nr:glycosyltransferase [Verrucomicrobiota bacterium]